ncbi:unnamed protein product, partial [marine sediment metagenome]
SKNNVLPTLLSTLNTLFFFPKWLKSDFIVVVFPESAGPK